MFLKTIEFTIVFLAIFTFLSQIIVPFFRGTPFFPIFKRERSLEGKIKEARQKGLEQELEKMLDIESVDCCENCTHPENRVCQNSLSPHYGKEVKPFNTCAKHMRRSI
jgi:hypothetical protein